MTSPLFQLVSAILLVLAPLLVHSYPKDCKQIHINSPKLPNGVYTIYPIGATSDMLVIQRRMDGTVNFYRGWDAYKTGFGNSAGEYWLGLENIHQLTAGRKTELLVLMEDFEGKTAHTKYSDFSVGDEASNYKLKVSDFQDGGAGDSLTHHNGMQFSTYDKDHDIAPNRNCAREFIGAF
ncbi:hypothetical protein LDENG_00061110 [Lucifuga dentata]|nr:hypothetical protein LDENG_00061110 [Lucifuga dentata]